MYAGPDLSQKSHLRGVQVLHMDMEKLMEDPGCLQLPSTLDVPGLSFASAQPPRVLVPSLKRPLFGVEIIVRL